MTNDSRSSKQRARQSAHEQAVCSLSGPIGQLLKIIILNRRSSLLLERRRCDRCTITALSKQREAAQVNIMIDWCNQRRPLQSAGTTWNDIAELSCCSIGVALCSPTLHDSPSATVELSTISANELATVPARPPHLTPSQPIWRRKAKSPPPLLVGFPKVFAPMCFMQSVCGSQFVGFIACG